MLFERLPAAFKTIRFRLAAWNALVILLTAWLVLLAVREGLHKALLDEMDRSLRDDLAEVRRMVEEYWGDDEALVRALNRKADSHIRRPWFVQFFDESGREALASEGRPRAFAARRLAVRDFPDNVGPTRLDEGRIQTPDGRTLDVRIGSSILHVGRRLGSVDFVGFLTTCVLLIVAPLVGYWLAGRATRPMAEVIETAERIRPEEITDRLPLRGSGDEIDLLSATINDLLDRLAVYLKTNREFLANAAHELRSPLAAVHSAVEVSLGSRRSAEEYEQLLADVAERTTSLTVLINQLLLLAETENERMRTTSDETDLASIVRMAIEMFEPVAEMRKIGLSVERLDRAVVRGDARRLRQVVINLIDNALKFTPAGGEVAVVLVANAEREEVRLEIRDTGMGIAPDELEHVFDRFYRGRAARQRREGSGLGLSICHSIVTGCGGAISVESAPGRGSTFTVRLQSAREKTARPAGREPAEAAAR